MPALEDFRYANLIKRANRLAQILLVLGLVVLLNYGASQYFGRRDLTRSNLYSLSPETLAYLRQSDQPVKVIVTIPENSEREEERIYFRYVHDLLEEYRYASEGDSFEVEYVDVFRELGRAQEIRETYGIDQPNLVTFIAGDRVKFLTETDIMVLKEQKPTAFKGEQAFTSALLEVTEEDSPVIYFVQGHGELDPGGVDPRRGASLFVDELKARNFRVARLDLTQVPEVPEDAGMLVIADPLGPFLPDEQIKLRNYASERAGRVFLLTGPGREHGLDNFLYDWGLRTDDMVVIEPGANYLEGTGNILLRQLIPSPVTDSLISNQSPLVTGLTRPVREDAGAPPDERLEKTALVATSKESWGESAWKDRAAPAYDERYDLKGPVPVAYLAQRGATGQLGINIPGGRVIVFGSGDLIANQRIATLGNFMFGLNTINWMLERERVLALPARPIEHYQLVLSREEKRKIGLSLLAIPAAAALLGLIVHLFRRR